ncbi:protein misato isoform X2 [Belonocnema kinseyi]|uniref:protein misato isoform X2 n=1 Tax=Belonocnema kinseyi TaxID=2817044 RepID=UPI00143CF0AD|nr:protein misato isoform X2 [Belonocnema kinseyi]
MTTREILTIQIGHYSNFIGTHWWNLQETNFSYDPKTPSEINHDVLYREGETSQKQSTYTPRLLLVDLKGSLGYLSEVGSLYSSQSEEKQSILWYDENIEITKEPEVPKTPFVKSLDEPSVEKPKNFEFENDVNKWVDYLVPRFHPRTVNIIKEYSQGSESQPFDIFNYGRNLWNTDSFSQDFTDNIRAYVEECDLIQGFQVLLDSTDGFAGLGSSCIQHLRDEYGKSILTFPSFDGANSQPSAADLVKTINTVLCWQSIGEHSSLFSPLGCRNEMWPRSGNEREFSNVTYDPQIKYQTAAILATALDTMSLRYRQKNYPMSVLSDLCADLNKVGRKAAAMSLNLPFPMTAERDFIDILDDLEGPLWTSLTPCCDISTDKNYQSLSLRGIPEDRLKRPMKKAGKQVEKAAYRCSTVHEMMSLFLSCSCHASATHLTNITAPLGIKHPYPKIFNQNVHKNGDVADSSVGEDVQSVAVMAGLHSGDSLAKMYEFLYNQAKKVKNIKRFHAFDNSGLEQDEFKDCLDNLLDCKEAYEDHYV